MVALIFLISRIIKLTTESLKELGNKICPEWPLNLFKKLC